MLSFQKRMSPLFFIARSSSLSLFFSLSFAGLSPACTFSFSLSFYFSVFQIVDMTINLSLILLDNTDTVVSASWDTDGYVISCQNNLVAFRLPYMYLLTELFYIGMPVVQTEGHAVTWLSEFLGGENYHIFLGNGLHSWRSAITLSH